VNRPAGAGTRGSGLSAGG